MSRPKHGRGAGAAGRWVRGVALAAGFALSGCDQGPTASPGTPAGKRGRAATPAGTGAAPLEEPAVIARAEVEWNRLDNPATDGWESEATSAEIKQVLDTLAGELADGVPDPGALAPVLGEDFSAGDLVPASPVTVYASAQVRVVRGAGEPGPTHDRPHQGAGGLARALGVVVGFLGEAGSRRCAFKVVEVRSEPGGNGVSTQLLVEISREGSSSRAEQHAEWTALWALTPGGPKLRRLSLERFEQSESPTSTPIFADCTGSALGANPSFHRQVLYGANHWLARIQDTRQMTLMGTPGTALGDLDGDGLDDLYLCQPGGLPNRLYLQNPDGTLRDATEASGTGWVESSRSALILDLDNDGDQDLAVATYRRLILAENRGRGRFEVAAVAETGVGTMGLCAADYDGDGDLDLYATHYSAGNLEIEAGATVIGAGGAFVYHDANNGGRNQLFRNATGRGGPPGGWVFEDVTAEAGLEANNRRFSLAAAWEDYDNDGDQDLYVANDFGRNNLYRNEGDGTFVDVAAAAGAEDRASGMSVSWGDLDRDGRMDVYIGNMFSAAGRRIARQREFSPGSSDDVRRALWRFARGNTLLLQEGSGFADRSEPLGVAMGRWAWSSVFADIDSDGWEDLLVANGYITTPDTGDL